MPTLDAMQGAGGTDGGVGRFLVGVVMMIGGGYLFLQNIHVHSNFGFGQSMYNVGGLSITSGVVLIPFMLGIGIIFYNSKNPIGWVLSGGAIVALSFGVISSVQMRLTEMSAFSLITILVLFVGGLGIFLSSLREWSREPDEAEESS